MNQDFKELIAEFNARGVRFLIVGAHALAAHGHVRATKDLDVWVDPVPDNAKKSFDALQAFGAPMQDLTLEDLSKPGLIFQIGIPPVRIDILTSIAGVDFKSAWADRLQMTFAGVPCSVLGRKHLILAKRSAGRTQDLADVEFLESLGPDDPK